MVAISARVECSLSIPLCGRGEARAPSTVPVHGLTYMYAPLQSFSSSGVRLWLKVPCVPEAWAPRWSSVSKMPPHMQFLVRSFGSSS